MAMAGALLVQHLVHRIQIRFSDANYFCAQCSGNQEQYSSCRKATQLGACCLTAGYGYSAVADYSAEMSLTEDSLNCTA